MNKSLESYSDELLLRTLQERGVKLESCSFIGDDNIHQRGKNEWCQKLGIYKKDEFPPPPTSGSRYPICYCPEHRDLLKNGDHQGWCTESVILPNGDTARCQHTGAFSWVHKQYLCKECSSKKYLKNEKAALVP